MIEDKKALSQMKYKERIKEFKDKKPKREVFTKHTLIPIKADSNPFIYRFNEMVITSYFIPTAGFFDITNDEILSIMEYYGLKYPEIAEIRMNHYTQPAIQGMASNLEHDKILTLFIPHENLIKQFGGVKLKDKYEASLCLLLHEISHLLGNVGKNCEPEADRFAIQEYKKWLEIL